MNRCEENTRSFKRINVLHNLLRDLILLNVCSFCVVYIQCSLIRQPQNVAALIGEVVTLECASDKEDSVAWVAYSPGSSDRDYIVVGGSLTANAPKYISVSKPGKGNCNLHINSSLTREAARRYICIEQLSTHEASAELILLERNPECLTKVANEFVNITCSVKFSGNWAPTMEWRTREGRKLEVEQLISFSVSVASSLFLPLNVPRQNTTFKLNVVTSFNETGRPKETGATNVPEYNHTISPYSSGFEYINVTQYIDCINETQAVNVTLIVVMVIFFMGLIVALIYIGIRHRKHNIALNASNRISRNKVYIESMLSNGTCEEEPTC